MAAIKSLDGKELLKYRKEKSKTSHRKRTRVFCEVKLKAGTMWHGRRKPDQKIPLISA